MLEMMNYEHFLCLDDIVYSEEIDYEAYEKCRRLINLGLDQVINGKLTEWDWKYMAKHGWLCEHDFSEQRFKKELEAEGITKDDYIANWDKEGYLE
jgi:hypothetical protein